MLLGAYTGVQTLYFDLRGKLEDHLQVNRDGSFRNEKGAGMVEYALLIVGIGILLIAAMTFLSGRIGGGMSKAGSSIAN